jgi:transcription factor CP2-like protein
VIRINCLSTEFSSQKGVKGIPLHLQVDTYEDLMNPDAEACHRGFCQIKVFRDKGAERKNKDESKSAEKRMARLIKSRGNGGSDSVSPGTVFNPPSKRTVLLSTTNIGPKPVYFTPVLTQPGQVRGSWCLMYTMGMIINAHTNMS